MVRYRIWGDGRDFQVQILKRKEWRSLRFLQGDTVQIAGEKRATDFLSAAKADEAAKRAFGPNAQREREWRVY